MSARDRIDEYLLGDLPAEEAGRLERSASEDPELRERIESGRALTDLLSRMDGDAWSPRPAPPLTIDPSDRKARAAVAPAGRRPWFAPRPAVALASAVALIAVGALGAITVQRLAGPGDEGGATVRLAAIGNLDPNARGAVKLSPDGKSATVSVSGLKPTSRGDYYEMWLMNSGTDLVSAGGFRVGADGRAKVEVPMPASMDDYRYFDISLERADGLPGHSGKSVVRSGPGGATAVASLPSAARNDNRTVASSRNQRQEAPAPITDQEGTRPMKKQDQRLREWQLKALRTLERGSRPAATKPARRETPRIKCMPLPMLSLTVCSSSDTGRAKIGGTKAAGGKAFLTALAASLAMAASLGAEGAAAGLPALPAGCEPNADRTSVICISEPGNIATASRITGCWSLEDESTLCVDPPAPWKPQSCDYAAGECGVVINPAQDRCVIPGQLSPLQVIASGKVLSVDWPWGKDAVADAELVASQQALTAALETGDYGFLVATCDPDGQGLVDPRRGDPNAGIDGPPAAATDDGSGAEGREAPADAAVARSFNATSRQAPAKGRKRADAKRSKSTRASSPSRAASKAKPKGGKRQTAGRRSR